jgi:hypothetical protein
MELNSLFNSKKLNTENQGKTWIEVGYGIEG